MNDINEDSDSLRVRVYRNLNRGGLSIQHKTSKGWRVKDYSLYVVLTNCKFTVREGGRQRVLRECQKNVHAWVEGDLVSTEESDFLSSEFSEPFYCPYQTDHFSINEERVDSSDGVKIYSAPRNKK